LIWLANRVISRGGRAGAGGGAAAAARCIAAGGRDRTPRSVDALLRGRALQQILSPDGSAGGWKELLLQLHIALLLMAQVTLNCTGTWKQQRDQKNRK
jgi:hypothetical protein